MNVIDYIKWRGDLSFEQDPINEVDLGIISLILYFPFEDLQIEIDTKRLSIKTVASQIKKHTEKIVLGLIIPPQIVELFDLLAHTKRFAGISLSNYVHHIEEKKKGQELDTQFCAFCADIDETRLVVFSGTDDTVVGWKEDLTMLSALETPAQKEAVQYLEKVFKKDKKLILCGHSKGGNLALYCLAKMNDEVYQLVDSVYNFDGPGLTLNENEFDLERMEKYFLYVPQTGIVGELFTQYGTKVITSSNLKGLFQHDIFTWEVIQNRFVHEKRHTPEGIYINRKIKETINTLTKDEIGVFLEVLFDILDATEAATLLELQTKKQKLMKSYMNLDAETKKSVNSLINKIILDRTFQKYIFDNIKEYRVISKEKKTINKRDKNIISSKNNTNNEE